MGEGGGSLAVTDDFTARAALSTDLSLFFRIHFSSVASCVWISSLFFTLNIYDPSFPVHLRAFA